MTNKSTDDKGIVSDDVLARAKAHLRQMAPHARDRKTAQLLEEMCTELQKARLPAWPKLPTIADYGPLEFNDGIDDES